MRASLQPVVYASLINNFGVQRVSFYLELSTHTVLKTIGDLMIGVLPGRQTHMKQLGGVMASN